jgi:hypothetical protein
MPEAARIATPDREVILARVRAERRQFLRVRIQLSGRLFSPADNCESPCRLVDISAGGALVSCLFVPAEGAQVILYVDDFGRLEATVSRVGQAGFGVRFQCSPLKREKIVEHLMVYLNRDLLDASEMRRHDRTPASGIARFTRTDGAVVNCQVLDLSLSGVSLRTEVKPPLGEIVNIGQTSGRVVRHHDNGIAIEFLGSGRASAPMPLRMSR